MGRIILQQIRLDRSLNTHKMVIQCIFSSTTTKVCKKISHSFQIKNTKLLIFFYPNKLIILFFVGQKQKKYWLQIATLGLRNVNSTFGVHKPFLKLLVSNGKKKFSNTKKQISQSYSRSPLPPCPALASAFLSHEFDLKKGFFSLEIYN